MAIPGQPSKRPSATSSRAASDNGAKWLACPSSWMTATPTTAIGACRFGNQPRLEIVNQSDKPISLLYYNIDWIWGALQNLGHEIGRGTMAKAG